MLSRVADSLYWLARYLERAEHVARLTDVQIHLMLDLSQDSSAARWQRLLQSVHVPLPADGHYDPYFMTDLLTFDSANANSIVNCISAARENALQLREHISSEMWEQLNWLYFQVKGAGIDTIWEAQPHAFFVNVKEGIHLFQGITDSTMNQNESYQFIEVGRYLERASTVAQLLDVHYAAFSQEHSYGGEFLEWIGLLKSCTAFEAYCKVYMSDLQPLAIAEFLLLNAEFPHSIGFSLNRVQRALTAIAEDASSRRAKTPNRLVGRLTAMVDYGQVDEVFDSGLHRFLVDLMGQCEKLHDAIYHAYVNYSIEREFAD
jgi:uncharacterized alpha-E superfamily protein